MRLERVIKGNLCAGCGLCASIVGPDAAEMRYDETGYLRPHLTRSLTVEEDDLIDQVCPGGRLELRPEVPMTPVWGPHVDVMSGWATDEEIRFRGSSGGALSAVLLHLLQSGEADYVLQVGAADHQPWLNAVATSTGRDDVVRSAGSRYAPSSPLEDIVQRLKEPDRFVFVGKPCDVAALQAYGRTNPVVAEKVVTMISFMCAGVPSEEGLEQLLESMGAPAADIASFRYRGHGWPGQATAVLGNGEERTLSYAETWGGVLSKHTQPRCKLCPDGEGAFADIVFADAWETDATGYPTFEELDGRSLVITRTALGARIVAATLENGIMASAPMDLREVENIQQHQARRTRLTLSRVAALAVLGRPFPRYRGLRLRQATKAPGFFANFRSFAGTARRVVLRRL